MEDNRSPPPCPSNADNPPAHGHVHLARYYYSQPQTGLPLPDPHQCLIQRQTDHHQCPSPTGTLAGGSLPGGSLPGTPFFYPYGLPMQGYPMQAMPQGSCERCLQTMLMQQQHALQHMQSTLQQQPMHAHQTMQYVAPRNLPAAYGSLLNSGGSNPNLSPRQHMQNRYSPAPPSNVLWQPQPRGPPGGFRQKLPSESHIDSIPPEFLTHHNPPRVAEVREDGPEEKMQEYFPPPPYTEHRTATSTSAPPSPPPPPTSRPPPLTPEAPRSLNFSESSPEFHDSESVKSATRSPECVASPNEENTGPPPAPRPRKTEAFDVPFTDPEPVRPPRKDPPERKEKRTSVRLDIPLGDGATPKQEPPQQKVEPATAPAETHHEPMAFTITFNDDKKKGAEKNSVDLTSRQNEVKERLAKKQLARRSMKKYGATTSGSDHSFEKKPANSAARNRRSLPAQSSGAMTAPIPREGDEKRFLLDRMLNATIAEGPPMPAEAAPDIENRSEAGTYVVDDEDFGSAQAREEIEKVFAVTGRISLLEEEDEDEGSKTPSPDHEEPIIRPSPPVTRPPSHNASPPYTRSRSAQRAISRSSGSLNSQQPLSIARPQQTASAVAAKQTQKTTPPVLSRRANTFNRGEPQRKSVASAPPVSSKRTSLPPSSSGPAGKPVHRGDGGRHSMNEKNRKASETSPQLNAWLLRKKYNPLKAVAEAKEKKRIAAQKATPAYLSERSISFHAGAVAAGRLQVYREQAREERSTTPPLDACLVEDDDFMAALGDLAVELHSLADATMKRAAAKDPSLQFPEMDLSDLADSDKILAQLLNAKRALEALNNEQQAETSKPSPKKDSPPSDGKRAASVEEDSTVVPYYTTQEPVPQSHEIQLQEKLNSLKPYWEKRKKST